jgi:phosphoribosyl 1,2-cyclic phosphate phosphodiesterase
VPQVTFLGTGTSQGVPIIGCHCEVCTSTDSRDKRLRASVLYSSPDTNFVIDAGPDFRQQMLRAGVQTLDAIFLTHEHNDHVIGMDDVRPFNFRSGKPMRVYAEARVAAEIKKRFEYVFGEKIPGIPQIELIEIEPDQIIKVGNIEVEAIRIMHGVLPILAFRIHDFCYITDMKTIPDASFEQLRDVKYLVTSALHHDVHPAHMNLKEAIRFAMRFYHIGHEECQIWLTHMSHNMGLDNEMRQIMPHNIQLSYDGMQLNVS